MYSLHPEQDYVFEIAKKKSIDLRIIYHTKPTISCEEKLSLLKEENPEFLEWDITQIVKALYFCKNDDPYVGVITPEFKKLVSPKDIFPSILGISKGKAERYWINPKKVPRGMCWGTCTPFPLESSILEKEISDIIFLDYKDLRNKTVNISVGGETKEAFKTSIHIPYISIYEILREKFGSVIHCFEVK
ncbi:MAG: hypothetical protein KatS3mg001_394 [Candidatus Pacearchaeota archaeon]|nr:MAG: hypothetical protein KatS3mg001_394 [Candidatus Pacearchaeota archaeon]